MKDQAAGASAGDRLPVDGPEGQEYAYEHVHTEVIMSNTRRTQLLMDPKEFQRLKAVARRRKTSVAGLIRQAVREAYLAPGAERAPIVEAILTMGLPEMDWKRVKREIEDSHADLP